MACILFGVVLCSPAGSRGVAAQFTRLEADLSASNIGYDSLPSVSAASLSTLAEWQGRSVFAQAWGGGSAFEGSDWAVQGSAYASGWLQPFGTRTPFRIEVAASAGAARRSRGFSARRLGGDGRLHLSTSRAGAWLGVGLGTARNSLDSAWVRGVVPNVGGWAQNSWLRGTVSYHHARIGGTTYPELRAAATLTRGRLDLSTYAGIRDLPGTGSGGVEHWVGVTGAFWVAPRVAVVFSAGQFASDILQGFSDGDLVSVGVRWTPRRVRPLPVSATAPIVFTPDDAATGGIAFSVEGARTVAIAGDWTGWSLVPLEQDRSGRWVVPRLDPGIYRFNLRVDGERWLVPEGIPTVDDGFGGQVGLLVVSGSE